MEHTKGELKIVIDSDGEWATVSGFGEGGFNKLFLPIKTAKRLVKCWNEYDKQAKRDDIMVEALAEIKALIDNNGINPESPQTIKDIIYGCIEELEVLAKAKE